MSSIQTAKKVRYEVFTNSDKNDRSSGLLLSQSHCVSCTGTAKVTGRRHRQTPMHLALHVCNTHGAKDKAR
jgi:hypothetical protein